MLRFKSFALIMRDICNENVNDNNVRFYRLSTFFLQVSNKSSTFATFIYHTKIWHTIY